MRVRQSYYSVPARYTGRRLDVALGATTVRVLEAGKVVAAHVRSLHKGTQELVLDHYLEVLTRKPGALAGSCALATARANKTFTPTHEAYWKAARDALGDAKGTQALIETLLLLTPQPRPRGVPAPNSHDQRSRHGAHPDDCPGERYAATSMGVLARQFVRELSFMSTYQVPWTCFRTMVSSPNPAANISEKLSLLTVAVSPSTVAPLISMASMILAVSSVNTSEAKPGNTLTQMS